MRFTGHRGPGALPARAPARPRSPRAPRRGLAVAHMLLDMPPHVAHMWHMALHMLLLPPHMLLVPPLSSYGIAHRALKAEKLLSGRPYLSSSARHAGEWHSDSWLPGETM